MDSRPTPEEVQFWLEWAGQKLLSLKVHRIKPESLRSSGPDYPDDQNTAYGYTNLRLRAPIPGASEIPLMDEILNLVLIIPYSYHRRIVNARLLVSPVNNRHLYSWDRIAKKVHADRKTVRGIHKKSLGVIAEGVKPEWVGRFRAMTAT